MSSHNTEMGVKIAIANKLPNQALNARGIMILAEGVLEIESWRSTISTPDSLATAAVGAAIRHDQQVVARTQLRLDVFERGNDGGTNRRDNANSDFILTLRLKMLLQASCHGGGVMTRPGD